MRKELQISRVARRQQGVITARQLSTLGVTASAITRWLRRGRLYRKHRGVYAVGREELSTEGRLLAAVYAIGEDAFLDDVSAAHVWGFWPYLKDGDPVHVLVARQIRPRAGIRVRAVSEIDRRDTTKRYGIPVVTPARALLGMAATLHSDKALRRAVHEAEVQRWITHRKLQKQIERSPDSAAAKRLAEIIAPGPTPTRSGDEDEVVELIRRHGLPRHLTNTGIPGLPSWIEVDVHFPDHGLVIEVDSPFHDTRIRQKDDADKQAIIEAHGLRVMRLRKVDASPANEPATVARIRRRLNPASPESGGA